MPGCAQVNHQLAQDFPGLSVTCETTDGSFSFSLDPLPLGIDMGEAQRTARLYFETDVRSGPWVIPFPVADIRPITPASLPANPVVVPSACDTHSSLLADPSSAYLPFHPQPVGMAGGGTLQSGLFTIQIGLACDPNFGRLKIAGDERSEINGLGLLWNITYQGEPVSDGVQQYSGFSPT